MDHEAFLGTLEKIAAEGWHRRTQPAGGGGPQEDAVVAIIERAAWHRSRSATRAGGRLERERGRRTTDLPRASRGLIDLPMPRLLGPHQVETGTASAALEAARFDRRQELIGREDLTSVRLASADAAMTCGALVDKLPRRCRDL